MESESRGGEKFLAELTTEKINLLLTNKGYNGVENWITLMVVL